MDEYKTYIQVLINSLEKKVTILDQLIDITKFQEEIIKTGDLNIDDFNASIDEKGMLIDQINQLDLGFESVYSRVKIAFGQDKAKYQGEIRKLQELIEILTDKSVKLQTMEIKNKPRIELYFANKKKEVKSFKMSSRTASSYYKNMADQHQGQSYFLDKKK